MFIYKCIQTNIRAFQSPRILYYRSQISHFGKQSNKQTLASQLTERLLNSHASKDLKLLQKVSMNQWVSNTLQLLIGKVLIISYTYDRYLHNCHLLQVQPKSSPKSKHTCTFSRQDKVSNLEMTLAKQHAIAYIHLTTME